MSVATLPTCPEIQEQLNQAFLLDPTVRRENNPLTEFLISPMNVGEVKLQNKVSPGNGKSKIVELLYTPRLLEEDVQESTGKGDCVASDVPAILSEEYEVGDGYFQVSEIIPKAQLRYICEPNNAYFGRAVNRLLDQLIRKIETFNFEQLVLLKGKFATGIPGTVDGDDDYEVATLTSAGTFNFDAFQKAQAALRYSGYAVPPIFVGGFNLENYLNAAKAGCCAASGINIEALYNQFGMAAINSYRADIAFGDADHFMAFAPGAVQMINYLENEGDNAIDSELLKLTTIVDPMTGLSVDLKINVDCNGVASIFMWSYNKLVGMPDDMFKSADRLTGVTFVNGFSIVNPS